MTPVFDSYSKYYDLLYQDKNYNDEVNYLEAILSQNKIKGADLLEFGSGTGRHANILVDRGFRVHGIEQSAQMVAQAKTSKNFICQQGNICSINLDKRFDAVLSLFHVISYQVSNTDLKAVFLNAVKHLNVGGLFIFDFWYSPAVYSQKPEIRVKRMSNKECEVLRIAEPKIFVNENRVDVTYTILVRDLKTDVVKIINETHAMRHFSLPEIELLAAISGFELIRVEEFLSAAAVNDDTWGACAILRKI